MAPSKRTRIPNSLKKHRKVLGYKQIDVALLLGFNNTARISRWEKGFSFPNTINLIKLSIIYRTFPNDLYFDLMLKLRHELLKKEGCVLINRTQNKFKK